MSLVFLIINALSGQKQRRGRAHKAHVSQDTMQKLEGFHRQQVEAKRRRTNSPNFRLVEHDYLRSIHRCLIFLGDIARYVLLSKYFKYQQAMCGQSTVARGFAISLRDLWRKMHSLYSS